MEVKGGRGGTYGRGPDGGLSGTGESESRHCESEWDGGWVGEVVKVVESRVYGRMGWNGPE